MPIVLDYVPVSGEGHYRPTIRCDLCGGKLLATEGHVRYLIRPPAYEPIEGSVQFVHAACEERTGRRAGHEKTSPGSHSGWMPIRDFLVYLARNAEIPAAKLAEPTVADRIGM